MLVMDLTQQASEPLLLQVIDALTVGGGPRITAGDPKRRPAGCDLSHRPINGERRGV
jgi:hypothetical protein